MKIGFEKFVEFELNLDVNYGLFVDDMNVFLFVKNLLFLQIYDIIDIKVRCVFVYLCLIILYGFC